MGNGLLAMHKFICEGADLVITFSDEVVKTMQEYRQVFCKRESGGLLFAKNLDGNEIEIILASRPDKLDQRGCFSFKPNAKAAQKLINEKFVDGMHYVGDWHTHSQTNPIPSTKDIKTISDIYQKSDHHLNHFIMVILSASDNFSNSYVALADENNIYPCKYEKSGSDLVRGSAESGQRG